MAGGLRKINFLVYYEFLHEQTSAGLTISKSERFFTYLGSYRIAEEVLLENNLTPVRPRTTQILKPN